MGPYSDRVSRPSTRMFCPVMYAASSESRKQVVLAIARAGRRSTNKQYAGLRPSAYLFWGTPMGKAAHQAINRSVSRIKAILPERSRRVLIAKRLTDRTVEVAVGWAFGVVEGQSYYLYRQDLTGTILEPIHDPATRRPLMVKIEKAAKESATGWLLGKPPLDVELEDPAAQKTT